MDKRSLAPVVVMLSLAAFASGSCRGPLTEGAAVTFDDLFTQPAFYNNHTITLEGYYFSGWETLILSENMTYSGQAPDQLIPDQRMLWFEGGVPDQVMAGLKRQQVRGPEERYGRVRVTGKFEYGGRYGHLGNFAAQIVASKVELLPWSPPPA